MCGTSSCTHAHVQRDVTGAIDPWVIWTRMTLSAKGHKSGVLKEGLYYYSIGDCTEQPRRVQGGAHVCLQHCLHTPHTLLVWHWCQPDFFIFTECQPGFPLIAILSAASAWASWQVMTLENWMLGLGAWHCANAWKLFRLTVYLIHVYIILIMLNYVKLC